MNQLLSQIRQQYHVTIQDQRAKGLGFNIVDQPYRLAQLAHSPALGFHVRLTFEKAHEMKLDTEKAYQLKQELDDVLRICAELQSASTSLSGKS